jgi:hypothetical protein
LIHSKFFGNADHQQIAGVAVGRKKPNRVLPAYTVYVHSRVAGVGVGRKKSVGNRVLKA